MPERTKKEELLARIAELEAHHKRGRMKRDQQLVLLFVSALNDKTGSTYKIKSWPDQHERAKPAVEAIAEDGHGSTMAIEHTLLEPFVGERRDAERFRRAIAPLEQDPALSIPGYEVIVSVPVGAIPKGIAWSDVAPALRDWLRQDLKSLPVGTAVLRVPRLGFKLELLVEKIEDDLLGSCGCFFVYRQLPPPSLEDVTRAALGRKLPKLRATHADRRVLLLEKADTVHDYASLRKAIDTVAPEFPQLSIVDEIWAVTTYAWKKEGSVSFRELVPHLGGRRFGIRDSSASPCDTRRRRPTTFEDCGRW